MKVAIVSIIGLLWSGCIKCADDQNVVGESTVCSETERNLWIGQMEFTANLTKCSAKSMGVPKKISVCLAGLYRTLSLPCGECLGRGSECAAMNCMIVCIRNQGSPACRACFKEYCQEDLRLCAGAVDDSQLPPAPLDKDSL